MNLFHNNKLLLGAAIFLGTLATSCVTNDTPSEPSNSSKSEGTVFYISLDVNYSDATSTRTNTGSTTDIAGVDIENKIESAIIYFFDSGSGNEQLKLNVKYIPDDETVNNQKQVKLISQVTIDDLKKLLGRKLLVYVVANMQEEEYSLGTSGNAKNDLEDAYFSGNTYVKPFNNSDGSQGIYCPMSNFDEPTTVFPTKGCMDLTMYIINSSTTDGEIIRIAKELFTENFDPTDIDDTSTDPVGDLWNANEDKNKEDEYYGMPAITLERMIARLDYKNGDLNNGSNVYLMENAKTDVADCIDTNGRVALKVNKITIKNINSEAYLFRHTAEGSTSAIIGIPKPFGTEGSISGGYNWISGYKGPAVSTFYTYSDLADNITSIKPTGYRNDNFSPWYYLMEKVVASTEEMNLENCTYLEFEVVLYNPTSNIIYMTSTAEENHKITMTAGDKINQYKSLTPIPDSGKYYYAMTYKYIIPHNIREDSYNGESVDGSSGKISSVGPMQYGIVRNCVYQIQLAGITSIPQTDGYDNVNLKVYVHVNPWDYKPEVVEGW